jgi:hypothetical protein
MNRRGETGGLRPSPRRPRARRPSRRAPQVDGRPNPRPCAPPNRSPRAVRGLTPSIYRPNRPPRALLRTDVLVALRPRARTGGFPQPPRRASCACRSPTQRRRRRGRLRRRRLAETAALLLPLGSGCGSSFARPARLGRYLQLDYLHGTGGAQPGGRRAGPGRCTRAVGSVVESATSARRASLVVVCMRAVRCLCRASVRFSVASVRRTNALLIHVFVATRRPHTPDLQTTSQCLMSYSQNTAVRDEMAVNRRAARSTRRHAAAAGPRARSMHLGDRQQSLQHL